MDTDPRYRYTMRVPVSEWTMNERRVDGIVVFLAVKQLQVHDRRRREESLFRFPSPVLVLLDFTRGVCDQLILPISDLAQSLTNKSNSNNLVYPSGSPLNKACILLGTTFLIKDMDNRGGVKRVEQVG